MSNRSMVPGSCVGVVLGWALVATPACNFDAAAYCDEATSRVASDDMSLGFSASSALGKETEFATTLSWADPLSWITFNQSGQVPVAISVEYDADERTTLVEATPFNLEGADPTYCASHLRTSARVRIATDDGALDESLDADVAIYSASQIEIRAPFSSDALRGTLALTSPASLRLSMNLQEGGMIGQLTIYGVDDTSYRQAALAYWEATPEPR